MADADRPTVILARTRKGRGFSEVEDREGWHGRPLPPEIAAGHHRAGRGTRPHRPRPGAGRRNPRAWPSGEVSLPRYELAGKVATRKAFGEALAAVGARGEVVALDGEVGNSTDMEDFARAHPERYFEMFIAEQQLVAAAVGLSVRICPLRGHLRRVLHPGVRFHLDVGDLRGEHPAVRLPCGG